MRDVPYFGPVTITGPIRYAAGVKGQCRQGPPSVPLERHSIDGEMDRPHVEHTYRIVAADLLGCGRHPDFADPVPKGDRPCQP
jgi:hypothetical protein